MNKPYGPKLTTYIGIAAAHILSRSGPAEYL